MACSNVASSFALGTSLRSSSSSAACPGETAALGAFDGLRRTCGGFGRISKELRVASGTRRLAGAARQGDWGVRAATGNGAVQQFDYDVVIIGAGVGGHGAALHAVEKVGFGCAFEVALMRGFY